MGRTTGSVMPAISVGKVCHPGLKREDNQDSIASGPTPYGDLFVVSDGVGGHYGGTEASTLVAEGLPRLLKSVKGGSPEHALAAAVKQVNAEVFAAAQSGEQSRRRMSATVVAALIVKPQSRPQALIVNVGDSRAYLVRDGRLRQLSTDHTAVQGMLDAGIMTPAQVKDHPHAGVLTRTIGQALEVNPSFKRVRLKPGDQVLLCSDGLHSYVSESAMAGVLTNLKLDAAACAKELLDLALAAGGPDNVSIQVIRVSGARAGRTGAGRAGVPMRTAAYAAAGMLALAAGLAAFYSLRSRASGGTATAAAPVVPATTAASPGAESAPVPPSAIAEEPLRIAAILPRAKEELKKFAELEHELGSIEVVTPAERAGSCRRLAGAPSIAWVSSEAVKDREPVKSSQIAQMGYSFVVAGRPEQQACGPFDLVLIPYEKREPAAGEKQSFERAKHPGDDAAQSADKTAPETTGQDNSTPHPITSLPPPPP